MKNNQMIPAEGNDIIKKALPCKTVPLSLFPGAKRNELAWCAIPEHDSLEQLLESFTAAPQFARIDLEKLLQRKGEGSFRVLLLGENDYYLRQAAAYLTAMSHKIKKTRRL